MRQRRDWERKKKKTRHGLSSLFLLIRQRGEIRLSHSPECCWSFSPWRSKPSGGAPYPVQESCWQQLTVSPAPFSAWRAQSCGSGEAQKRHFLVCFLGPAAEPVCRLAGGQGLLCPRQFFARIYGQSKATAKIFSNRERVEMELWWCLGEHQICIEIMHVFNGLDLKTGLSPPEASEAANRKLSQASGCSCGVVTLHC